MDKIDKRKIRKYSPEEARERRLETCKRYYEKSKVSRKEARLAESLKYREKNRELLNQKSKERYHKEKDVNKEHKLALNRARNAKYRERNKDRLKESNKAKSKKYRNAHPERIRNRNNEYYHRKTKEDLGYKLALRIRGRTKKEVIKSLKTTKNGKFNELSGCSHAELKSRITSQFTDGMTIDNYGTFWNVDHIIPVSLAKGCPTALRVLSYYTNLRPMIWQDNLKKSDNCDPQLVSPEYEYYNPLL